MHADIKRVVFLFVDQYIVICGGTNGMSPDLIRQQRRRVFAHVPQEARVIALGESWRDVFQDLRRPFAAAQILKT